MKKNFKNDTTKYKLGEIIKIIKENEENDK